MENRPYITMEEVRKNKIKSLFLILIMVAIVFALSILIGYLLDNIQMGFMIALIISVIVFPIQILSAKASILAMSKGKQLDMENEKHRMLKSVVEGLTISAGMKRVPDIYIVPTQVPNAFASGMSEKNAFIGVTQGLLDMLDKQELTGVLAHEISHIVHRDIMLSQLAVSLVSIILMLSTIAARLAYFSPSSKKSSDNNNGNAGLFFLIIVLAAILIQPIARLVANLIQLSISRKREYAADAYAVRLCGYNEGLASALEKISGLDKYSKEQVASLGGSQMKCMYIYFPTKNINSIFSTHPPVEERIRILRNMY